MGTRNTTVVTLDNKIKIAQYGQWDGYPAGQGQTIAEFLRAVDLVEFRKKVHNLTAITEEEADELMGTPEYFVGANHDWAKEYPWLSRDTGAEILQMVADGETNRVFLWEGYDSPDSWVEYVYTINLDKETVTIDGHYFQNEEFGFEEWVLPGTIDALDKYDPDYYHDMKLEELEEHYTKIVPLAHHFPDYIQNLEKEMESRK